MIALRAFGLIMKEEPVNRVVLNLAPATIGGALLMTATGTLIFSSGATRYIDSASFQVKMVFYLFAFITQCVVYLIALREKEKNGRLSPLWIVLGSLALLLWFGVGVAGRAIAFI